MFFSCLRAEVFFELQRGLITHGTMETLSVIEGLDVV